MILGFGGNRTEVVFDNDNFRQHYQYAGYVAYGLGFNNASVKLVVSRADLSLESPGTPAQKSAMTAGRVRLTYPF